ncbi:MAG: hypothetical protein SFU53_01910 [Terrimicrobiaceae bacterium]|nr:hypothetical protein [Terrimicrobiaceae bacterium]
MNTFLESLEDRIAPAGASGASVTVIDVDGDEFQLTASKGTSLGLAASLTFSASNQLEKIDLSGNTVFSGADISFRLISRAAGGDGSMNVGAIDASGIDLGAVRVKGDLGRILVGDTNYSTPALKSLQTFSMGSFGISTQGVGGSLLSTIEGPVGSISILGDLDQAGITVNASGGPLSVQRISVGGSIIGSSSTANGGSLQIDGFVGQLFVGGNLIGGGAIYTGTVVTEGVGTATFKGFFSGGSDQNTGSYFCAGPAAKVTVGGMLIGGSGLFSGSLQISGTSSLVTIGGDVQGGLGDLSGRVFAGTGKILRIDGDVIGGSGTVSGYVGGASTISISGDVVGGSGNGSAQIETGATALRVEVGGKIVGGGGTNSGSIVVPNSITLIRVDGDLIGGSGSASGSIVTQASNGLKSGTILVNGSVIGGSGTSGYIDCQAGADTIRVTGDVEGGTGDSSGRISGTRFGSVFIGGSLLGGANFFAGSILTTGLTNSLGTLTIRGDIVGGSDLNTGSITAATAGTILVGGDIRGGADFFTGAIQTTGGLAKLTVKGSLWGGSDTDAAGFISVGGTLGNLFVGGSVVGGTNSGASMRNQCGAIQAGNITVGVIQGSLIGGSEATPGTTTSFGSVRAFDAIGSLRIEGNLTGGTSPAMISAGGNLVAGATTNLAIANLQIGGNVENAIILTGYSATGTGIDGDGAETGGGTAQIGSVVVGGNWVASSIAAGATTGSDTTWGTATNALLDKSGSSIVASIASLVIRGNAWTSIGDPNGLVAERLALVSIGGTTVTPAPGPATIPFGLADFTLRQVN